MKLNVRLLYLYLFSFVGLLIIVIGSIQLVDLGIKVYVFKGADTYEYSRPLPVEEGLSEDELRRRDLENQERQKREVVRQRQRQFSTAISMIVIGLPLYLFHWKTIEREKIV